MVEIPTTAAAATLTGPYGDPYQIVQKEVPQPAAHEALVSLSFSGVCHGDVYSRDGGGPAPAQPNRPLIGGHEGIGTIVALGEHARNSPFKVGDLVGIAWRTAVCGKCEACVSGQENYCEKQVITGMHISGTYQRKPVIFLSSCCLLEAIPFNVVCQLTMIMQRIHRFSYRPTRADSIGYRHSSSLLYLVCWSDGIFITKIIEPQDRRLVCDFRSCGRAWPPCYSVCETFRNEGCGHRWWSS